MSNTDDRPSEWLRAAKALAGVIAGLGILFAVVRGLVWTTASGMGSESTVTEITFYGLTLHQSQGRPTDDAAEWWVQGVLVGGSLLGIANGLLVSWVVGRVWRSVAESHADGSE